MIQGPGASAGKPASDDQRQQMQSRSEYGQRPQMQAPRQQFEQRGKHMWERLSALPKVTCVRPQGAFYCFPNVSAYFGKSAGAG